MAGGTALMLAHGVAMAGISGTKHDLSVTGSGNKFTATNGSSEICAFCHTPHGADTAAPVPLWNRVLGTPGSYTTYAALGTSSLDGAVAPVGSVSLACLSCHDGTQAMNTTINQAGSGGYNASGALQAGTWVGSALTATPVGSLNYATPSIVNIGTDLRNDHPVGVQYGGGGFLSSANLNVTNATAVGTPTDADFVSPKVTGNATTAAFWVDTGTAGRQKTDLILYTRTEPTVGNVAQPFVECATCHDPHTNAQATFLRTSNTSSALCLACHTK
ncbi:MAG: hypothetical protein EPN14_03375 [Gallionella sp.]|nr:MAG: hypothetical protein EPN14_03375 [Gallionella sp.]